MRKIMAVELLVRDLATCAAFYQETLGLPVTASEPDQVVFKVGDVYLFVMEAASAATMMSEEPLDVRRGTGSNLLLATSVDDVDAMYADLTGKGVRVLRPPADQPWGLRTAYFADPEGNFWEINQPTATPER